MAEGTSIVNDSAILISTFVLGEAAFGIDTAQIQEVVRAGDITPVHQAPDFVVGVMNLRGRISTVIDLAVKLELGGVAAGLDNRIFIIEWQGEQVGLLVDKVTDALTVELNTVKPAPENVHGVQGRFFKGVCYAGNRLIALLDLTAILQLEDERRLIGSK